MCVICVYANIFASEYIQKTLILKCHIFNDVLVKKGIILVLTCKIKYISTRYT